MSRLSFELSVAKPCQEQWSAMTGTITNQRSSRYILAVVLLVGSSLLRAWAQSGPNPQASLGGSVTDSTGAVITHVTVQLFQEGKLLKTEEADKQGHFNFPLSAGEYQVHVLAEGFSPENLDVRMGEQPVSLANLVLRPVYEGYLSPCCFNTPPEPTFSDDFQELLAESPLEPSLALKRRETFLNRLANRTKHLLRLHPE